MDQPVKIRRVLIVASDEFSIQAMDEAAAAFSLLVRRSASAAGIEPVLREFGPDAVILDPAVIQHAPEECLRAIGRSGASLLLLGSPDAASIGRSRALASSQGLRVAGILAKPVVPETLELALRVMVGELGFSAADIGNAVMRGEVVAWYQLQLSRSDSGWRSGGAEALARWQHPEHGVLMPAAFVPVAEAEGQIAAITDCVLQTSVQQLGIWRQHGMPLRISVNLSPALVTDPAFPERLSRLMSEFDVPPRALLLEIPESSLEGAPPGFIAMLSRLRVQGFGLVLDHFGSGASSVAELYRTPFSELKIDRSLVGRLQEDEDAQHLVSGIIALAHELGLSASAEAVENRAVLQFLHQAGCDQVQGFGISRALPARDFQVVASQWL